MSRILITGSLGFLGSHLADYLIEQGHEVYGIDNMTTNVIEPRGWDYIGDYRAMNLPRVDQIYHLASPVGPVGVLSHAGTIADEIVSGACRLAQLARAWSIPLLFVSTSEVYGADGACWENDPCQVKQSAPSARQEYAVGKLAAEILIRNTVRLDYRIVRPFNIAGPRQSPTGGFVVPRFIKQALANQPITVYGDGSQQRAFTHVEDIVKGLVLIMEKGSSGLAYNLGNLGNRVTILELAKLVKTLTGSMSQIQTGIDPQKLWGPYFQEVGDKWPGNVRARMLGWNPVWTVTDIIQQTLEEKEMAQ